MILPFVHGQMPGDIAMAAISSPPRPQNNFTIIPPVSEQLSSRTNQGKATAVPQSDHAAHLRRAINRITHRAFYEKREPRARSFVDEARSMSGARPILGTEKGGSSEASSQSQVEYFTLKRDRLIVSRPMSSSNS